MTGPEYSRLFKICFLLPIVLLLAPTDFAYPADDNIMGEIGPLMYPASESAKFHREMLSHNNRVDKPKGCFHFYVSRNMSSLLSDATKMLQQVRDRREREWILTFIYRIKSLTEHLRTHPDSRNYDCLSTEDDYENRRRLSDHLMVQQPELYFVDDLQPNHNQKRSGDPEAQTKNSDEAISQPSNTGVNPTDNQKPDTWQEQSTSNVLPEKEAQNFNSVAEPSSTQAIQPAAHVNGEGQNHLTDSIPTASAAIQSELSQPEESLGTLQAIPKSAAVLSTGDDSHQESPSENKQTYDNVIVISSSPDCEQNAECEEALNRQIALNGQAAGDGSGSNHGDDLLVQELHSRQHQKNIEEDRIQQKVLKKRIRKALLEEMAPEVRKLRTVGGSEEDLINLWRQSESDSGKSTDNYYDGDFDYEETGAAAGDLNSNDALSSSDQTVAPSLGDMKNFKRQSNKGKGTKAYEPYDDSDVLVKQLFDVRFEQTKTTKSLGDQREEYLITSTHIPY